MKKCLIRLLAVLAAMLLPLMGALAQEPLMTFNRAEVYLRVNQAFELEVQSAPKGIRPSGFTFASTDESIATVNRDGSIKGVSVGECEVIVTSKKDPTVVTNVPVHVVIAVDKVTITAASKRLHVGEALPLSVTLEPADATYPSATFESLDEKIATVDENGVVTGIKKGTVTIKVHSRDGKKSSTIELRVLQQPTSIELTAKNTNLTVGKTARLTATVLPDNASNKNVTWSSSDASIISVNKEGVVTAHKRGSAVITVTSEDDPSVSAQLTITGAQLVKSVSFSGGEPRIHVGDSFQLSWTTSPEDATDPSVSFASSHSSIATVDGSGLVTGVKAGKATITVKTLDGSDRSSKITVHIDQPASGVHMEKSEIRIAVGYHGTVKAVLEPEGATNTNMKWTSSDPSIATVSGTTNTAKIKGHKWGDCIVTGVTEDGGYSTSIQVHIGSYRFAIKAVSVKIRNQKPYLTLKNISNLNITQVRYQMRGFDRDLNPIDMTTRGNDRTILTGSYDITLAPGDSTQHGRFTFNHPSDYAGMFQLDFCITGITTADGLVYNVSKNHYNWISFVDEKLLTSID